MFPKKGKLFPSGHDRDSIPESFPAIVARALRAELGPSHRAAKTLMRWTGASERAVKHWLSGRHGPRGEHLLALLRESDAVFESLMIAADRGSATLATRILAAQTSLDDLLARLGHREAQTGHWPRRRRKHNAHDLSADRADAERDRIGDRENDRDSYPEDPPIRIRCGAALNPRQRWYLDALGSGLDVRATDLRRHWNVSEKTARRDLASLKASGLISFSGPRRGGRYELGR